jgi:hypothetical protein
MDSGRKMRNIAYVVGGLWRHHPGLHSKVLGAARVWEANGATVKVVLYSEGRVIDCRGNTLSSLPPARAKKLEAYYDTKLNKFRRLAALRHQYAFLKEALADLSPDIVYTRYALPFPGIHRFFGAVCPYVIEINSDDLVEYGLKSSWTGRFNRFFRKGFMRNAAGLCFISREMATSPSFNWYRGKTDVIANSINCDDYPFVGSTANDQVNLCFIGSPGQCWHGLDKINLLSSYYPQWTFHIIGPGRDEYCASGIQPGPNIVFHGYLSGQASKDVLQSIDVGISTLALHRKSMKEASPLKSRQYLAQGIPFISAYDDTDIAAKDFVYQLPNTESNVSDSLAALGDFVIRVFRDEQLRLAARAFAETRLDSRIIERKRLEFISSCL